MKFWVFEVVFLRVLARHGDLELLSNCSVTSFHRVMNKIGCSLIPILDLIERTFHLISINALLIVLLCLFAACTFLMPFLTNYVKAPFAWSRCCLLKILVQPVSDHITA